MKCFCLRCQKQTETKGGKVVKTNGRSRLTGKCAVCGAKKSCFVASGKGSPAKKRSPTKKRRSPAKKRAVRK